MRRTFVGLFVVAGCLTWVQISTCDRNLATRFYLHYADHSRPPLEELYLHRGTSYVLWIVMYDSDGDWIPDKEIRFSRFSFRDSASVRDLPRGVGELSPRWDDAYRRTVANKPKDTSHTSWEDWLEPPDGFSDPINTRRKATPSYAAAWRSVGGGSVP